MATKTIYGQAFIAANKSLVQDQIILTDTNPPQTSENTVTLIEDIWADLQSQSSTMTKTDGKGHWYWEVTMTDIADPDVTVTVKMTCPKPDPALFDFNFEEAGGDSDWTKYWKGKMKEVQETKYQSINAIQPREVLLKGTKYINQESETVIVEDTTAINNDLGDIQNLLSLLY